MPENLITVQIIRRPPQKVKGGAGNIVHAAATHATHVVVWRDVSIETALGVAHFQLPHQSGSGEQFQVAIYGPQADFREPASDDLVDADRRRVRGELAEFLQDDLPLPGIALEWPHSSNPNITTGYHY